MREAQKQLLVESFVERQESIYSSFILHKQLQSNRAIISSFVIGVKLSISRPLDPSEARMCCGTKRWLSWGAIDSSGKCQFSKYAIFESELTMAREIKECGQILDWAIWMTRIRKSGRGISQLIKEWVNHSINGRQSLGGSVLEQARNQLNGVRISLAEDLVERVRLDLREFVLHVVRVHGTNLVSRGRTQNFDNLYQLIDTRLSREQRLTKHQLSHDAAS